MSDSCHPTIPSIDSLFSKEIINLLNFIQLKEFTLTLVGGAVRDYFLYQKVTDDLDFEIRKMESVKEDAWKKSITDLAEALKKTFRLKIEFLEFGIFKFSYGGKNFEFSSPRTEMYDENKQKWNHKDFAVSLICNLDYEKSFARRDFTMNAIGFEFLENRTIKLIDPFNGVGDIAKKLLRPCGVQFFKDPIRFLRLLRFAINTGFKFSSEISLNLHKFNLENLTHSYFLKEAFKTNSLQFFKLFFSYVKTTDMAYNQSLLPLFFLLNDGDLPNALTLQIHDEKSLLVWMIFSNKYTDKNIMDFASYAKINQNFMKNMFGLRDGLATLLLVDLEKLLSRLQQVNFLKLPDQNDLDIISDFYTSYKRNAKLMVSYLHLLPDRPHRLIYRLWEEILSFYPRDLHAIKEVPPKSRKVFGICLMLKNYFESRQKLPK